MFPKLVDHIKRHVELSDDDVQQLLSLVRPLTLKKKDFLLKGGQVCKSDYFVEKGCLRMYFINEKGIEQITQFAIENWWLSDYMSLINQTPSQFFIQAIEPTDLYCVDKLLQNQLFNELPQLEKYFRIIAQKAFAAAQQRVKYFADFSKEEAYKHFSSNFPGFVQRVPQYMLASYLGFTPEYLSELRKKY